MSESQAPLQIVGLKVENFKVLKAIHIHPAGPMVKLVGKNGAGKTSVMDSIEAAFGGKDRFPRNPVRKGQKRALVEVDLGELLIRRTISDVGATTFSLVGKDGGTIGSPQKVMDKLYNDLACDPIQFKNLKPAEQAAALSKMVGVDAQVFEAREKTYHNERTEVNRRQKEKANDAQTARTNLEQALKALGLKEPPAELVVPEQLVKQLKALQAENKTVGDYAKTVDEQVQRAERCEAEFRRKTDDVQRLERQLVAAREEAEEAQRMRDAASQGVDSMRDRLRAMAVHDTTPVEQQIIGAGKQNKAVELHQSVKKLEAEAQAAKADSDALTDRIEKVKQEFRTALAAARLPIEGLAFTSAGVTYHGTDFGECSEAEKLRISAAVAMSGPHRIKVLLIRDGSLMDRDSERLLAEIAQAHDYQCWVEMADRGQETGIHIVDGLIVDQPESEVTDGQPPAA